MHNIVKLFISPSASLHERRTFWRKKHAAPRAWHRCPHLPQQSEHFGGLLRLLLAQQPLDVADPRHAPDVGTGVAPPQNSRELVGLEHQGGEQQVPSGAAAAPLDLRQSVAPLASPPGQLRVQVEAPLPGQLRTHHFGEDVDEGDELLVAEVLTVMRVVMMRGISQHAAKNITAGSLRDVGRVPQKSNTNSLWLRDRTQIHRETEREPKGGKRRVRESWVDWTEVCSIFVQHAARESSPARIRPRTARKHAHPWLYSVLLNQSDRERESRSGEESQPMAYI